MADEMDVREMLKRYYAGHPPNLTDQEALEMNGLLYSYAMQFRGCRDPTGLNASNLNLSRREMFVCREEVSPLKYHITIIRYLRSGLWPPQCSHYRKQSGPARICRNRSSFPSSLFTASAPRH
jgi:hypothetical protein